MNPITSPRVAPVELATLAAYTPTTYVDFLKPENKAYSIIRPEGTLEIFGVMVGLVRKL